MMNEKGISEAITYLMVILIGIAVIAFILISLNPALNQQTDQVRFEHAKDIMQSIDLEMKGVVGEGFGAKKNFTLPLRTNMRLVDSNGFSIDIQLSQEIFSEGNIEREGDVRFSRTGRSLSVYLDYNSLDLNFLVKDQLSPGNYQVTFINKGYDTNSGKTKVDVNVA